MARSIQASPVSHRPSWSLASRRWRPSQAKGRSTTQRRGSSRNPFGRGSGGGAPAGSQTWRTPASGCCTTSTRQPNSDATQASNSPL